MAVNQVSIPERAPFSWNLSGWYVRVIAMGLALVLAIAQTIGPNAYSPLEIDEQVTYYLADGYIPVSLWRRCIEQSATPPLYFWIVSCVVDFGQRYPNLATDEWWLRLPSLGCFLLAIATIAALAERCWRGMGGVAALLLACHPQAVAYSVYARPYITGIFLQLLAAWFWISLRKPGWRFFQVLGAFAAIVALVWTHYLFILVWPWLWFLAWLVPTEQGGEGGPHQQKPPAVNNLHPNREPCSMVALSGLFLLAVFAVLPLGAGIVRLWSLAPALTWVTSLPPFIQYLEILRLRALVITLTAGLIGWGVCWWRGKKLSNHDVLPWLIIWLMVLLGPLVTLWVAATWVSPALAQTRYHAAQIGVFVLALTGLLRFLGGQKGAYVLAMLFLVADQFPWQLEQRLRRPVHHDPYWRDAARFLEARARPNDLILVQSGLVESQLLPLYHYDDGYQEYVTSRLSHFYGPSLPPRLALPLPWVEGTWISHYQKKLTETTAKGGDIWLVLSADTDVGQTTENGVRHWLQREQFVDVCLVEQPVARIYHCKRQAESSPSRQNR